jgi:acetyltransferase
MTQPDGRRHVAYIALTLDGSVGVGVVRYVRGSRAGSAEVAIAVADAWQGQGLGAKLMCLLIEHAQAARVETLFAVSLSENGAARKLAYSSGFTASGGGGIYAGYTRALADGAVTSKRGCGHVPSQ